MKSVNLPIILYWYETWYLSLSLSKKEKFDLKEMKKQTTGENSIHSSFIICTTVRVIK
jgi:hypothetical protein